MKITNRSPRVNPSPSSPSSPPWILIAGVSVVAAAVGLMLYPAGQLDSLDPTAAEPQVDPISNVRSGTEAEASDNTNTISQQEADVVASPQTPVPPTSAALPPLPLVPNMVPRSPEVIRDAYTFAARRPDILEYVPCFCGCETAGHSGNADCFVDSRNADGSVRDWDTHGMACTICIDVARDAMQMHTSGATVRDIRAAIDSKYSNYPSQTPTPSAPH